MGTQLSQTVTQLLRGTDIAINGTQPCDIQVKDERFFARVISQGSLGLGESYMDGWWECGQIDELVARLMRLDVQARLKPSWTLIKSALVARFINLQAKHRAFHIGEAHYDLGNDLYRAMLDKRMVYTCAYWTPSAPSVRSGQETMTLDEAQEAKLDLVCRKIGLKPGQKVLDIGCGWGSFAKFAAEKYGVQVVGVTVSKEQAALARELCAGLPIEIRLQDYRDVNEPFDHIVSLGMVEHVGCKNYRTYFEVARRCLKDDGLFLLQSIGSNLSAHDTDPWIAKYIFPNSMLPSAKQLAQATEGLFVMEDWHNFSSDYDRTLMAWHANFEARWPELLSKYDERFRRMWRFYLLSCAGSFRARQNQLWQIVYSPHGVPGGYRSIR